MTRGGQPIATEFRRIGRIPSSCAAEVYPRILKSQTGFEATGGLRRPPPREVRLRDYAPQGTIVNTTAFDTLAPLVGELGFTIAA